MWLEYLLSRDRINKKWGRTKRCKTRECEIARYTVWFFEKDDKEE